MRTGCAAVQQQGVVRLHPSAPQMDVQFLIKNLPVMLLPLVSRDRTQSICHEYAKSVTNARLAVYAARGQSDWDTIYSQAYVSKLAEFYFAAHIGSSTPETRVGYEYSNWQADTTKDEYRYHVKVASHYGGEHSWVFEKIDPVLKSSDGMDKIILLISKPVGSPDRYDFIWRAILSPQFVLDNLKPTKKEELISKGALYESDLP